MAVKSLAAMRSAIDPAQSAGLVYEALKEIQGLKVVCVAGAAAANNIAVSGIATADTLVGVIDITDGADRTAEASITSAGNIQLSTTTSASKKLLVVYFVKPT